MPSIQFKGKSFVQNYHLSVPYHQLIPQQDKSLTDKINLHDNLVIHGDNLLVLKALLPMYAGKVGCIYIDPPYNTGNEGWVFNDRVNSPLMNAWIGNVVGKQGEDFTRDDKWLCMMMPRLKILKELLNQKGLIFVSIDDNELHHLRLLMNEIFGAENYRNTIVVRRGIKNVQSQFETVDKLNVGHEYVLVYTKDHKTRLPKLSHAIEQSFEGKWDTFWRGTDRPSMRYELFGQKPSSGQWRWEEGRAKKAVENYKSYVMSNWNNLDDYYRDFLTSANVKLNFVRLNDDGVVQYYVPPRDYKLISDNWMDISIKGKYADFDTEKTTELLKRIIRWATEKTDVVLDSFAGSGTTGHAVLELNKEDGGNRKFILVECEDYANDVAAQRIRDVIKRMPSSEGTLMDSVSDPTFSYFELGDAIEVKNILEGNNLPSYLELARYVFYTATGEEFSEKNLDESRCLIGLSSFYDVYMLYKPDLEYLKQTALTLDVARELRGQAGTKRLLVFALPREGCWRFTAPQFPSTVQKLITIIHDLVALFSRAARRDVSTRLSNGSRRSACLPCRYLID
jgi:DNA modification methylase